MERIQGTMIRSTATFRDTDDALTDPAAIVVTWRKGDGSLVIKTDADVEVVHDSLGVYHMDLLADVVGRWTNQWEGTGLAVDYTQFVIAAAPL